MEQNEIIPSISEILHFGRSNSTLLNEWEIKFLTDAERTFIHQKGISPKQEVCLRKIAERINIELEKVHAFSSHQISYFKKIKGLL